MKPFDQCTNYPDVQEAVLERCISGELRERIQHYFETIRPTAIGFQIGLGTADLVKETTGACVAAATPGVVLITLYKDYVDGQEKKDTVFFELVNDRILQLISVDSQQTELVRAPGQLLQ